MRLLVTRGSYETGVDVCFCVWNVNLSFNATDDVEMEDYESTYDLSVSLLGSRQAKRV